MLSSIYRDKFKKEIEIKKLKNELVNNKNIDEMTLFEIYENKEIVGYFLLNTKEYQQWILDYKMEGIEI